MKAVLGFSEFPRDDEFGRSKDWSKQPKYRNPHPIGELQESGLGGLFDVRSPSPEFRGGRRTYFPDIHSPNMKMSGKRHVECEVTKYSSGMDWSSTRRQFPPLQIPNDIDRPAMKIFKEFVGYESGKVEDGIQRHHERRHHDTDTQQLLKPTIAEGPSFEQIMGRKKRVDEVGMRNGYESPVPGDKPYTCVEDSQGFYNESTVSTAVWKSRPSKVITNSDGLNRTQDSPVSKYAMKVKESIHATEVKEVFELSDWESRNVTPAPETEIDLGLTGVSGVSNRKDMQTRSVSISPAPQGTKSIALSRVPK